MSAVDPIDDLIALAARFEAEGTEPGSAEHRLCVALRAWVSGAVKSLEEGLDLVGSDTPLRVARARHLRAERDAAIAAAADLIPVQGAWCKCEALAREVLAFETRGPWARFRHLEAAPPELDRLRAAIFTLLKGGPVPATPAGLRMAVRRHQKLQRVPIQANSGEPTGMTTTGRTYA